MAKGKSKTIENKYVGVIKGVITSLVMCVLAILIYAVVLKTFNMSDKSIPYFNQVVKILGIIITSYYSVKNSDKVYLGLIGGIVFIGITYMLFSLVNGSPGSAAILGSDIVMGAVIGVVFAIIASKILANKSKA